MKFSVFLGFFFFVILLKESPAEGAQGISNKEILIGTHTSLSGPAAIWGVSSVNGMKMYFEKVNAQGGVHGRKIKLIVEDHQYQVPRAVQAVNKLINKDRVFAILAALGTPMNNAVMKQIIKKKVPNVFPYTAARSMHTPRDPMKVAALTSYYQSIRKGMEHFIKSKKVKKVCLMAQDTDYGQEIKDAVMDELKVHGLPLVAESLHKPTEISFAVAQSKLAKSGCEMVVLGTIIKDTIQILSTAKKKKWDPIFLGGFASYDSIIAKMKGKVTEGFYVASPFVVQNNDTKNAQAASFIKEYQAKFGKEPGTSAQLGYIFAEVFVKALEKAGKDITLDSFIASFDTLTDVKVGIQDSPMNFSPKRNISEDRIVLSQIKNEQWIPINEL